MHVIFHEYLKRLDAEEKERPIEDRRRVPSLSELAKEIGIHEVTFRNIANGNIKQLNLSLAGKIITTMRRYGFQMSETDLVKYEPETDG